MDPALWEILKSTHIRDNQEVEVVARLHIGGEEVPYLRPVSLFGPIVTGRVPKNCILKVRNHENVASLKASRIVSSGYQSQDTLSEFSSATFQDQRRPKQIQYSGKNVVIGVIDWGCDFAIPSFRKANSSSRLLGFWDQRSRGTVSGSNQYGYGRIFKRSEINHALRFTNPYSILDYHPSEADSKGNGTHGTHVMDIAAGNGQGDAPMGIAPEADLVFVHLANGGTRGLANLGDSVRILEALDFVRATAGDRPFVINLSVGRHGGPHDGLTLAEMAFDYLLKEAPNRFIVQSTGNYYDRHAHTCGQIGQGQSKTLTFNITRFDLTPNELEIWYSGSDELAIKLTAPTGAQTDWVRIGEQVDLVENNEIIGRIYNRRKDPNNLDNMINCFLFPNATAGEWQAVLKGVTVKSGLYHAWLERDDGCIGCQAKFVEEDANPNYTTGTLANGHLPLVVGAYNAHVPSGNIAPFSSVGPTRDGRSKPDLVAPGLAVLAAKSTPKGQFLNDGSATRKSGTSMAAPHVTGTVALLLQAAKKPLTAYAIRKLILNNTQQLRRIVHNKKRYGQGFLDIVRVVNAIEETGTEIDLLNNSRNSKNIKRFDSIEPLKEDYFMDRLHGEDSDQFYKTDYDSISQEGEYKSFQEVNNSLYEDSTYLEEVYRDLVYGEGNVESLQEHYSIVALPGEVPEGIPEVGDILFKAALGEPGLGQSLALSATERIIDDNGRLPLGHLLLRPNNILSNNHHYSPQESSNTYTHNQYADYLESKNSKLDIRKWKHLIRFNPPIKSTKRTKGGIYDILYKVQTIKSATSVNVNLDYYPVYISKMPTINGKLIDAPNLFFRFRTKINNFLDTGISEFSFMGAYDESKWLSPNPVGAVLYIDISGPDNAYVLCNEFTGKSWKFSTLTKQNPALIPNDEHPVSGTREFGYKGTNERAIFYTQGADRASFPLEWLNEQAFKGGHRLWRSFQKKLVDFVNSNGGKAKQFPVGNKGQTFISVRRNWKKIDRAL